MHTRSLARGFILGILTLFVFGVLTISAQTTEPVPTAAPELIEEPIGRGSDRALDPFLSTDPVFIFDEDSTVVSAEYGGDVYVLGDNVTVTGTIGGDLIVLGGDVFIEGTVIGDVRILGAEVELSGVVVDDVLIAGGRVHTTEAALIEGSLIVFGSDMRLAGYIQGQTYLIGGEALLNGMFEKDVQNRTDFVGVLPNAEILGELSGYADASDISPQATIGMLSLVIHDSGGAEAAVGFVAEASAKFFAMVTLYVAALVLWYIGRAHWKRLETLSQQSLAAVGKGLTYLVVGPFVSILLLVSVIGTLLGGILLAVYVVDLLIAIPLAVAVLSTRFVSQKLTQEWARKPAVQIAIGTFVFGALNLVPVIGGIVSFSLFLFGLGLIVIWTLELVKSAKKGASSK